MMKANAIGFSDQVIMMPIKILPGLFMVFLHKENSESMSYTELQVTTNFSFLRGASHPEELVEQAGIYGYGEIAITDRNTLAGIVRAHAAAKAKETRVITGCHL